MEVTVAILSSLSIAPVDPIAYGAVQQFHAIGSFSDGSTQDLTSQVDWTSSDTDIATIDEQGLATTVSAGEATIEADYPGWGTDPDDSTTLTVRRVSLQSITVTPATDTINRGETLQFTATGTYSDSTALDITDQVVWSSGDSSVAIISNGADTNGLATGVSTVVDTTTITASSGRISGTASLTVNPTDLESPTISSAQLLAGGRVRITYSEQVDALEARNAANYKVVRKSAVDALDSGTENCANNGNFTHAYDDDPDEITIKADVVAESLSSYILEFEDDEATNYVEYMVIVNHSAGLIEDLAGNDLACENTAVFMGNDTTPPYMVIAVASSPSTVTVRFSEPMNAEENGPNSAYNASNYEIEEVVSGLPLAVNGITRVNDFTYILQTGVMGDLMYEVTVHDNVTDQAPEPIPMGSPLTLSFKGNDPIKVISAMGTGTEYKSLTVYFSKPVEESTVFCDSAEDCGLIYKLAGSSDLGDVTYAVRDSIDSTAVNITHTNPQEGSQYTVIVANGRSGDDFDNLATERIEAEDQPSDYIQAKPRDRATFIGTGPTIASISDGEYFTDPFADGSAFTWSFVYSGRVYLGTNDYNNAAFRFDANGYNSVLTTFSFSAGTCSTADGFGYGTIGVLPTCGVDSGPNEEVGVVGFNSGVITIGTTDYDVLMVGPLKDGVSHCYYTQDVDTQLDWTQFGFAGTGGGNTDSIQTSYAYGANMYMAASSTQGQQAPVVCRLPFTDPESDGVLNPGAAVDMSLRSINYIGKQGSPYDNYGGTAVVVGIDVFLSFNNRLYIANNGGVVYSSDYNAMSSEVRSHPDAFRPDDGDVPEPTSSEETLVLPAAPAGLGKLSPGQRGVPRLIEYNGKLYMARNVAYTAAHNTVIRGELWKCSPATSGGATTCEPDDWERIITGVETDLPDSNVGDVNVTGNAISLLQNNGSTRLYVGFDHPNGVTVWRVESTDPGPTTGTMASVWTQAGILGLGNSHTKLYSSATIFDGTYDYIYLTAGDDANAIRVYRQRE